MNAIPTANDMMSAYAEDAVEYCRERFSVDLDYSAESVESVERVLAALHDGMPKGFISKLLRRQPPQEVVEKLSKMLGGYVGEVMRRNWGGNWKIGSEAFPGENVVTLELSHGGDVWPHFKAGKRIVNGPEDNIWHYFKVMQGKYSV